MTATPGITTPYQRLGGDAGVRRLVERFYALMDSLPEARGIRALHPVDLAGSRENLYLFLSGWLGGPPLYAERRGQPMLRARHLPFAIGPAERDQWMQCMRQALAETVDDELLRVELGGSLARVAEHMRNDPESPVVMA
jgi:hemoglobin